MKYKRLHTKIIAAVSVSFLLVSATTIPNGTVHSYDVPVGGSGFLDVITNKSICDPLNETYDATFDRWVKAEMFEQDSSNPDDLMGEVNIVSGNAECEITNSGGDLAGPNGVVQNGDGESGDEIEVFVRFTYIMKHPALECDDGTIYAAFETEHTVDSEVTHYTAP